MLNVSVRDLPLLIFVRGLLYLLMFVALIPEGVARGSENTEYGQYVLSQRVRGWVEKGDFDEFKKAMDKHASEDEIIITFELSDLFAAIKGGNYLILKYMMDYIQAHETQKYDKKRFVYDGRTLLEVAVESKNVQAARLFLQTQWFNFYDVKSHNGDTEEGRKSQLDNRSKIVLLAIKNDDVEMVKLLDEFGYDFDEISSFDAAAGEIVGMILLYGPGSIDKLRAESKQDNGLYSALSDDAVNIVRYVFESRGNKFNFIKRKSYIQDIQVYIERNSISIKMLETLFSVGMRYKEIVTFTEGKSLLERALESEQGDLVDYLLSQPQVGLSDDGGELHTAIAQRNKIQLEKLLKHQIQLNPNWSFGNKAFWENLDTAGLDSNSPRGNAVKRMFYPGQLELVQVFCRYAIQKEKEAALNALLAIAVEHGEEADVRYLLSIGASPNVKVRYENGSRYPVIDSALDLGIGNVRVAEALVDAGADISYISEGRGRNLLHQLSLHSPGKHKNELLIKMLDKKIMDVNLKTKWGEKDTPLRLAVMENDSEEIAILCQYGASVSLMVGDEDNFDSITRHSSPRTMAALRACGSKVEPTVR